MHFYALRIVCKNCGAASLLGGGAEHDLTQWHESTIECRRCGAETPAAGAEAMRLGALPRRAEALEARHPGP